MRLSRAAASFPVGVGAAVASALLLSLANPPADVGPIAFVSVVPVLWSMAHSRPRRAALLGFLFGFTYYGLVLYWILLFGVVAWLPLVVSQAAWLALFGALVPILWSERRPVISAVGAAAAWTALDWARAAVPVAGFTWGGLGYTQHGNGLLLPIATVAGVWGVTFVVVVANALVVSALDLPWRTRRTSWRTALRVLSVGVGAALLPALIPIRGATGPTLDVATVQGNVPRSLASNRLLQDEVVTANHVRLNQTLASNPPDLVVWPEGALYDDPTSNAVLRAQVSGAIRAVGAPTIVQADTAAPGGRFYRQSLLYSPEGNVVDRYTKIHLVPYGEYAPFRRYLGWVGELRLVPRDLVAGDKITAFHVDETLIAAPICFENVFPNLFRSFVDRGATLVILTTNDSSYLDTPASREHVIMSQLRAVETGRWIVQAAVSGESAIVNAHGQVVRRLGLFRSGVLRADVPESRAKTIYTRLGDWFPWACGIGMLGWLLAAAIERLRRRRRPIPSEDPPAGERTRRQEHPAPIAGASGPRVLVILPTYNERQTILRVLQGVLAVGSNIEALVVDDASPDGTGDLVAALAEEEPRVRLLRRLRKRGLASAYLDGFTIALDEGHDVIVEMDADISHSPEDLPRLLEASERFDLTLGSRYIPGGGVSNWSRARVALSRTGNAYAAFALRIPVHDATSGFRAYRHKVLRALVDDGISSEGYAFQVELVYRAIRLGFSVGEVPITFREREHGHSKLSRRIVAEALWRVTQWGARDRFDKLRGSDKSQHRESR